MTKPPLEEATQDLANIRLEVAAMARIKDDAEWLARRDDVDGVFYANLVRKLVVDIERGKRLIQRIVELYPELAKPSE